VSQVYRERGRGGEEEKKSIPVVYSRALYQGHEIKSKNSEEQLPINLNYTAPKTDHDLAKICSVVSCPV
jgi:hypothetical protein